MQRLSINIETKVLKDFAQQDKEKFLELGEEKFREDCYNEFDFVNKTGEYPGGFNPEDVITNICEGLIDRIKSQIGTLPENQTSTSVPK